jgi:chromosome segregation ATPase
MLQYKCNAEEEVAMLRFIYRIFAALVFCISTVFADSPEASMDKLGDLRKKIDKLSFERNKLASEIDHLIQQVVADPIRLNTPQDQIDAKIKIVSEKISALESELDVARKQLQDLKDQQKAPDANGDAAQTPVEKEKSDKKSSDESKDEQKKDADTTSPEVNTVAKSDTTDSGDNSEKIDEKGEVEAKLVKKVDELEKKVDELAKEQSNKDTKKSAGKEGDD